MEAGIGIYHLVAAVWLIWLAVRMKVENEISFTLFKFIPALFGVVEILLALKQFGFIIQVG